MVDIEGKKLVNLINSLQKQDDKLTDSLKKIVNKYSNENVSIEEIAFFYRATYTRAVSFLGFSLRCWGYEVNKNKSDEFFDKSLEELTQYKPKGFPLKRVEKLTTQIDELDAVMKRHKVDFWKRYCLPVLQRKDMEEINEFTHSIYGDGISILKHRLYDAYFHLQDKSEEEYNQILNRKVLF